MDAIDWLGIFGTLTIIILFGHILITGCSINPILKVDNPLKPNQILIKIDKDDKIYECLPIEVSRSTK